MESSRSKPVAPAAARWAPALVVIAVTIPFLPCLLGLSTTFIPLFEDEAQWSIYARFIGDAYSRGLFPLWAHDLYSGFPLSGWSHAAIFYPLSVIFQWWDFAAATWINQWVHSIIFALGMYAFGLRAQASRGAATAAAITGGLVFVLLTVMNAMPVLRTAAFIPLWCLSLLGLVVERRARWLAWHLATTLMMYLGGDAEIIALGYEFAGLALGALVVVTARRDGLRAALRLALPVVVALAAGFLLSQLQALPTLELTQFSVRKGGLDYAARRMFVPPKVLLLLLPALGPALVTAIAATVRLRRTPLFWPIIFTFGFCLIVPFDFLGLLRLLDFVPVIGGLANQYRILLFAFPCLLALAARGIDDIAPAANGSEAAPVAPRWVSAAGAGLLVNQVLLVALAVALWGRGFAVFFSIDMANNFILAFAVPLVFGGAWLAAAPRWAGARPARARRMLLAAVVGICAAVPGAMPTRQQSDSRLDAYRDFVRSHPGRHRVQSVYRFGDFPETSVPAQTGGDGTMAADGWVTVAIDRYARLLDAFLPETVQEENGRVTTYAAHRVLKEGSVNQPAIRLYNLLGIKYLLTDRVNLKFATDYFLAYPDSPFGGPDPARLVVNGEISGDLFTQPGDRLRFQASLAGPAAKEGVLSCPEAQALTIVARSGVESRQTFSGTVGTEAVTIDVPLRLSGEGGVEKVSLISSGICGLILESPEVVNPGKYFQRVPAPMSPRDEHPLVAFRNPGALPLAFLAPQTVSATREEAAALMQGPKWDPARTAVAEEMDAKLYRPLKPGEGAEITTMDWSGVTITARADTPRTLVLTDVYYPGWQAWVNGNPVRLHPVDLAFKGIGLAAGRSKVRLEYRPVSFRLGLWITLASLLSLAAFRLQFRPSMKR